MVKNRGRGRPKLIDREWEKEVFKNAPKRICYVCGRITKNPAATSTQIIPIGSNNPPVNFYRCKRKRCYSKVIEGVNIIYTDQGTYSYNKTLPKPERFKLLNETELAILKAKEIKMEELKPKVERKEVVPKRGMIATLVEMLEKGECTFDELVQGSGASPATVTIQTKYRLKQAGVVVVINKRDGIDYYSIQKGE